MDVLRYRLEAEGYTVIVARDGEQALQLALARTRISCCWM